MLVDSSTYIQNRKQTQNFKNITTQHTLFLNMFASKQIVSFLIDKRKKKRVIYKVCTARRRVAPQLMMVRR